MNEEHCSNCKFYALWVSQCRRHAPIVIQSDDMWRPAFPTMPESGWCGDWEAKEEKKEIHESNP